MLTEISWWGGLLFIWWAAIYRYSMKETPLFESFDSFFSHLSFVASAILLALFFYPLDSSILQYGYAICFAIAVFSFVLVMLLPAGGGGKDAVSNENAEDNANREDDDGVGLLYNILASAVLYVPQVAPSMLAAYKSWELAKALHWIS